MSNLNEVGNLVIETKNVYSCLKEYLVSREFRSLLNAHLELVRSYRFIALIDGEIVFSNELLKYDCFRLVSFFMVLDGNERFKVVYDGIIYAYYLDKGDIVFYNESENGRKYYNERKREWSFSPPFGWSKR